MSSAYLFVAPATSILRERRSSGRTALVLGGDAGCGGGSARCRGRRMVGGERRRHRKGGTLRLGSAGRCRLRRSGALVHELRLEFATCAKLFNYPDASGAAGTRLVPEVVKTSTVSRDGRTYDFELKRTFRFHTGAAVTARSFAAAFNRDANPRLESPAKGYMREIVGAVAVMEGKAKTISGVRVLGRVPAADQADQAGRRLHRPADDALLLPDPAEHADRPGGDRQSGRFWPVLRGRADREPAHRPEAESVLPGRPAGERRPDGLDDRRDRRRLPARKVEQDQLDLCLAPMFRIRRSRGGSPSSTGSTGRAGSSSVDPALATPLSRLQPRPARVQGAGPDRVEEGDQLRDRPAGARRAYTRYLAGIAHRPDAAAGARPGRRASTRSVAPTWRRRASGYARAKNKPQTLVFYARQRPASGSRSRRRSSST